MSQQTIDVLNVGQANIAELPDTFQASSSVIIGNIPNAVVPGRIVRRVGWVTAMTAQVPNTGELCAEPFLAAVGGTIDLLGFQVTTSPGGAAQVRMGIYASGGVGMGYLPTNLLVDSGPVNRNVAANQPVPAPIPAFVLTPGVLYWIVSLFDAGPAGQVAAWNNGHPFFGYDEVSNAPQFHLAVDGVAFAALPAVFPLANVGTVTNTRVGPSIWLRFP